jgi:hypothetical protein
MTQQVPLEVSKLEEGGMEGCSLVGQLTGDISAAALSATLISPILAAIDR